MKITCPKTGRATHKRRSWQFTMPIFMTATGKILSALEGYQIYQQVQALNDHDDVRTEAEYQFTEGEIARSDYIHIMRNIKELANDYRAELDADGHWNDVLRRILDCVTGR